ncbi:seryl-tRNA synthetase [Synechococcus sp. PCC 7502]|uniref:serine--tRNA ligase n=1 Tax=Synechococcus sp. PCC 7502 TaxID=1173263 RepID=UPI00029FEA06|nr:serine--tRNA ligase [Synechococcus sp. PCC 7502]AFY73708.1 seryl-tRNA synthetase [Synechococcus sp. PCC 7502]
MLDIKLLRSQPTQIQERLNLRGGTIDLTEILTLDQTVRELETRRSQLEAESNDIGKQVGKLIQAGNKDGVNIQALKDRANEIKQQIASTEPEEKALKDQIRQLLLVIPNLPDQTTPIGKNELENIEVRRWGNEYKGLENLLPHYEIGEKLGIMNFERAVKVAQSRFVTLLGAGAALERALIQFMLNTHTQRNYQEVLPPYLVNSGSLIGTGQLPKFAEDAFKCAEDDLWLIPTAEVPVTNLYSDEILEAEKLPIYHCAFTPCFRREAGSYGRDVRGLIRLHQFHKVELVKFVHPDRSADEHESLVADAEFILQALKLPYRVIELCTGDLGFGAAKCYDLEVWLPSVNQYREISSCSNFNDFQARRANIRFKAKKQKGTEFVHTLNGSALAVGRTMAAILENYQDVHGRVVIPEVLQPYLGREYL